jgi:cytochrome o ubiquinol oxidase subunit II
MPGRLAAILGQVALPFLLFSLGGCDHLELLNPKGAIGEQEKNLILIALGDLHP